MRGIAIVCAVALVGGCDPGFRLQGRVSDADGRPVENATVHVKCEGGSPIAETHSDARGVFSGWDIGVYANTCMIEALTPDRRRSKTWPIMSACTEYWAPLNVSAPLARNALLWPHPEWPCLEVKANLQLP